MVMLLKVIRALIIVLTFYKLSLSFQRSLMQTFVMVIKEIEYEGTLRLLLMSGCL